MCISVSVITQQNLTWNLLGGGVRQRGNHLLTADFDALVRPVLTVRLPIAVPPLGDTLAVATHKVHVRTCLCNWSGERKEMDSLHSSLIKHLALKKQNTSIIGRGKKTKAMLAHLMNTNCSTPNLFLYQLKDHTFTICCLPIKPKLLFCDSGWRWKTHLKR